MNNIYRRGFLLMGAAVVAMPEAYSCFMEVGDGDI
jgi:hypothetical protein